MAKIEMVPLEGGASSAISALGYDPESRTLHVQFKTGKTYTHEDVPLEKVAALTGARSVGSYYNTRIRPRHPGKILNNDN